jgi:hypothetical protein
VAGCCECGDEHSGSVTTELIVIFLITDVNCGCLLGCCTVWSDKIFPTFQICMLAPSCCRVVSLMIVAESIFETPVNFKESTRRNIPLYNHLHNLRRVNLQLYFFSHIFRVRKITMKLLKDGKKYTTALF